MTPASNKSIWATALAGAVLLAGCERPPPESVQQGYRGTGMVAVTNPRLAADKLAGVSIPPVVPAMPAGGPTAGEIYENVQVLGDLSVSEFARIMVALTSWVSPEQSCAYCHVEGESMAADTLYTKVVSRSMIDMNRKLNTQWTSHVKETGVTCYTCHRGQPVPPYVWFQDPGPTTARGMAGNRAGQNAAAWTVALASLPYDPFSTFLKGADNIRVASTTALPAGSPADIMQTERTYGLMMHMSDALGINCTGCHNSRSFSNWEEGLPQRVTAWYGIRMTRNLNLEYLEPLQPVFPEHRLGPLGDVAKINCETCHQGLPKPLNGVSMFADYPELGAVRERAEPVPESAPVEGVPAG